MNKVKFEPNDAGIREYLNSPEVMAELESRGQRVMAVVPDGFEMESGHRKKRGKVTVRAVEPKAIEWAKKDNKLLKALNSAKG